MRERALEEDSVAARGDEGGDDGLHVLLIEIARAAAEIAVAFFMGAEAEEGFAGREDEVEAGFEGGAIEDGLVGERGGAGSVDALRVGDGCVFGEDVAIDGFRGEGAAVVFGFADEQSAVGVVA